MEHYSTLDEGALYRFNWIFPSQKLTKGGIGFGGGGERRAAHETFAYLDDELIEAKIVDELRDHPLLLVAARASGATLIEARLAAATGAGFTPADYFAARRSVAPQSPDLRGAALLVPRRLRQGAAPRSGRALLRLAPLPQAVVTVEPQMAVDARSRQLTMDRSLALAAAGAAVADALRVPGRAGRRQPRPDRVRRSAQAPARGLQVPARHRRAGAGVPGRRQPGARHRLHRLVQRGLPGGLQGDPRVPVVQGAHRAGAGAVPARLPRRAADLRGADPGRPRGVGQARRAARRLGGRAVGGADPHEEAARREVPQGALRPGASSWARSRRRSSTPTAVTPGGADQPSSSASCWPGSTRSRASRTPIRTTRAAPAPRRAR